MEQRKTILEDLSGVIGFTNTLKLMAWFGGDHKRRLYIPLTFDPDQIMAKVIGEDSARRLIQEWPGEFLSVPSLPDYEADVRKRKVKRMIEQNFGTQEIAGFLEMSERRIQQICRELELAELIPVQGPQKSPKEKVVPKSRGVFSAGK